MMCMKKSDHFAITLVMSFLCHFLGGISVQADVSKSLPSEWWKLPSWSPDHKRMAVFSPGPEKIPCKNKNGTISYGYTYPQAEHTKIVRCIDYSVIAEIDGVFAHEWSPDATRLAAIHGGFPKPYLLSVFDAATGATLKTVQLRSFAVMAWSPKSDRILVTESDRVSIFDTAMGELKRITKSDGDEAWHNGFWSPSGENFGSVQWQRQNDCLASVITIWNSDTDEIVNRISVPNSRTYNCGWSPTGEFLAFEEGPKLHLLDEFGRKEISVLRSNVNDFIIWKWTPDGKKLVYGDYDAIKVFDPVAQKELLTIEGPADGFFEFALSPDSRSILICSRGKVAVCSLETGKYFGYKEYPDCSSSIWNPNGDSIVLEMRDKPPQFVALSIPIRDGVFLNGKTGSPGWENNSRPKNLEECFAIFNQELSPAQIKKFKNSTENGIGIYGGGHIITDSMMCDVYCKWGMASLNQYFAAINVHDPCEITGIILHSYWRRLNGKDLEIDSQIRRNQAWNDQFRMIVHGPQLSEDVLNFEFPTKADRFASIRSLPGKVKLIVVYANRYSADCCLLRVIQKISTKNHSSDLSALLLSVDLKFLGRKDNDQEGSEEIRLEIEALEASLSQRFQIGRISRKQWDRLSEMIGPNVGQIIILSKDSKVIARIQNCYGEKETEVAVEKFIAPMLR
jgi:Tol biopolymer transport system component